MGNTDYIIDIAVDTCFLDDQSAPEEGRFVFAYTIHIRNLNLEIGRASCRERV